MSELTMEVIEKRLRAVEDAVSTLERQCHENELVHLILTTLRKYHVIDESMAPTRHEDKNGEIARILQILRLYGLLNENNAPIGQAEPEQHNEHA